MVRKYALFDAKRGELGGAEMKDEELVEFKFFEGKNQIGALQVSATAVRWKGRWQTKWTRRIPVQDLDILLSPPEE